LDFFIENLPAPNCKLLNDLFYPHLPIQKHSFPNPQKMDTNIIKRDDNQNDNLKFKSKGSRKAFVSLEIVS
jgi:hypothetical protein